MKIPSFPKLKVVTCAKCIPTLDCNHLISIKKIHESTYSPKIIIDGEGAFKDDMYPVYTNYNFCPYKLAIETDDSQNKRYLKIYWFADGNKFENKILMS